MRTAHTHGTLRECDRRPELWLYALRLTLTQSARHPGGIPARVATVLTTARCAYGSNP